MAIPTKPKRSVAGIELVRILAYEGDRIFTTDRARELAPRAGLSEDYVLEALHHPRRNDWIVPLRRGLYRVDSGTGQNRTLRPLSALWPPVFAGEQDVDPPKG